MICDTCMLTKRTNILFEESTWKKLEKLAYERKISVGELVRRAVEDKYSKGLELEERRSAIDDILKARPKPFKGEIDYKELISHGRKH